MRSPALISRSVELGQKIFRACIGRWSQSDVQLNTFLHRLGQSTVFLCGSTLWPPKWSSCSLWRIIRAEELVAILHSRGMTHSIAGKLNFLDQACVRWFSCFAQLLWSFTSMNSFWLEFEYVPWIGKLSFFTWHLPPYLPCESAGRNLVPVYVLAVRRYICPTCSMDDDRFLSHDYICPVQGDHHASISRHESHLELQGKNEEGRQHSNFWLTDFNDPSPSRRCSEKVVRGKNSDWISSVLGTTTPGASVSGSNVAAFGTCPSSTVEE